jgi:hypothetical protein
MPLRTPQLVHLYRAFRDTTRHLKLRMLALVRRCGRTIFTTASTAHLGKSVNRTCSWPRTNNYRSQKDATNEVPSSFVSDLPLFEFEQLIHKDATTDYELNELSANVDDRVDSLTRPISSWEYGQSPVGWPGAVAPFDFSPAKAADE